MEDMKKQRKKTLIRFGILCLISGLCGGFGSLLVGQMKDSMMTAGEFAELVLHVAALVLLPVICLIIPLAAAIANGRLRKRLRNVGDEEEQLDRIDASLDFIISTVKISSVLAIILYGILTNYFSHSKQEQENLLWIYIGVFMVGMLGMIFTERALIDTIKLMNPAKQGDALDMNFRKKWMQSCDEMEQSVIYRAAYQTYIRFNYAVAFLFLFLLILNLWFDLGLLPLLCVGGLWLLASISYIHEARKLSRKP